MCRCFNGAAIFPLLILYHLPCNSIVLANQYSIQQTSTTKKTNCNLETFQLYDGYKFIWPENDLLKRRKTRTNNLYNCLRLCKEYNECHGINYDGSTCQIIEEQHSHYQHKSDIGSRLIRSNSSNSFNIFAEKICINDFNNNCNSRSWAFELIIGYHISYPLNPELNNVSMVMNKVKKNVTSTYECSESCLNELSFTCRSAFYNGTNRECILSDMNRHTLGTKHYDDHNESPTNWNKNFLSRFMPTSSFSYNNFYIENKCVKEPKDFCDFKKIRKYKLKSADLVKTKINSQSECRELCLSMEDNLCKSFDFDSSLGLCRLSHLSESSTIHMFEAYSYDETSTTYEISACYNVSIQCQSKMMKIQIETTKLFNGKIYAQSQPKNCVNDVINRLHFELSVPYSNSTQECGTRQPIPGRFANDIIIQHHDLVLTTKDLALGVFCKFDLLNASIAQVDLKIQGDIATDKLKGTAKLPELSLHLVDHLGNDVDEVSVGDILRVQIRINDEDTYGIFVRNLIAKDNFNPNNNFTLIDSKGCPAQMRMMREVRLLNENGKTLESYLEAFTFTGGSLLIIQVEVETCLDQCKPVQCQVVNGRSYPELETVTSYGKRKRRSLFNYNDHMEKGDIISMTKLSKSLFIREKPEPNVITSSSIYEGTKRTIKNSFDQFTIKNENYKTDSTGNYPAKIIIANRNYICFEPTNLLIFCAVFCFIQVSIFSLVFYIIIKKMKNISCKKRHLTTSKDDHHSYHSTMPYNFMG